MRQLRSNEVYKPTTRESPVLSQCCCCFFFLFTSFVQLFLFPDGAKQDSIKEQNEKEKVEFASTKTKTNYTFAHTLQPTYIIRCFSLSLDHSVGALFSFVCLSWCARARIWLCLWLLFFFLSMRPLRMEQRDKKILHHALFALYYIGFWYK